MKSIKYNKIQIIQIGTRDLHIVMLNAYKFVKIGDPFSCGYTQNCIYVCTVKLCDIFENRGCPGDICAVCHRLYHLQSCSSFIVPIFRD